MTKRFPSDIERAKRVSEVTRNVIYTLVVMGVFFLALVNDAFFFWILGAFFFCAAFAAIYSIVYMVRDIFHDKD